MFFNLLKCDRSVIRISSLCLCISILFNLLHRNNYFLHYLKMNFCPINTHLCSNRCGVVSVTISLSLSRPPHRFPFLISCSLFPFFFLEEKFVDTNDACRLKIASSRRRPYLTISLSSPLPPHRLVFCPSPRSRRSLIHIIHSYRLVTSSSYPCPSRIPQSIRL